MLRLPIMPTARDPRKGSLPATASGVPREHRRGRSLAAAAYRAEHYGWPVRLVIARCSVDYFGRLTAQLPPDLPLLIVRPTALSWCTVTAAHSTQFAKPRRVLADKGDTCRDGGGPGKQQPRHSDRPHRDRLQRPANERSLLTRFSAFRDWRAAYRTAGVPEKVLADPLFADVEDRADLVESAAQVS
jgi:hypothetical protein